MNKLPSFEYKKMIFHNVKDNLFQTNKFGDKLIYKYENGQYNLVRDKRLSSVITLDEISKNPFSYNIDDNNWKQYRGLTEKCIFEQWNKIRTNEKPN